MSMLFLYLPPDPEARAALWPGCPLTLDLGDQRGVPGHVVDVVADDGESGSPEPMLDLLSDLLARCERERQPALLVRCRFEAAPLFGHLPTPVMLHLTEAPAERAEHLQALGLDPAEFGGRDVPLLLLSMNRRLARDDGADEYGLLCVQPGQAVGVGMDAGLDARPDADQPRDQQTDTALSAVHTVSPA